MKKVSTVAAKQTMNFPQPKLTISLDLGERSSWYCLLDEVGDSDRPSHGRRLHQLRIDPDQKCRTGMLASS